MCLQYSILAIDDFQVTGYVATLELDNLVVNKLPKIVRLNCDPDDRLVRIQTIGDTCKSLSRLSPMCLQS